MFNCTVKNPYLFQLILSFNIIGMGIFGQSKSKDPRETVREMQKKLRAEQRGIDRNINHIKREELKVHFSCVLIIIRGF